MVADPCSRDGNRSRSNAFVSEEISVEGRRNASLRQFRFRREIWPKTRKVGGIVVVVALLAFFYRGGHLPGQNSKVSVTIEAPKVNP